LHVYEVVCAFIARYDYPPTSRELAFACGFPSNNTAWRRLDKLREVGFVGWRDRHIRTLRVVR
jgi:SOS-response transcriptional repressor LexA